MLMDSEIYRQIQALLNIIRVGEVSSVNGIAGTVKVVFEDKDNMVSSELLLFNREYDIPDVGEDVLCIFLPNGIQQGFCFGGYYSKKNPPPVQDSKIYRKTFDDGTYIQYDKATKVLTVTAANPIVINGDIQVTGNIHAGGTITGSNIT